MSDKLNGVNGLSGVLRVVREMGFLKVGVMKRVRGFDDIEEQKWDNKGDGGEELKINKCFWWEFGEFFDVCDLGDGK
ncbi:hypothetical protein, partial [Bacillus velezensis]|uniref:hypothetical protein n=1 Tax=Bacillus velezensis TaxID=492670 RepID=UPI0011A36D96